MDLYALSGLATTPLLIAAIGISFKILPYQLSMVLYWNTMVITGNGELGFYSGDGALKMATTSKEGSRRENYPLGIPGGSNEK